MAPLMDHPAPAGGEPLSAAGELEMPFSDTVKYVLLAVSVALLVLALGILAWQAFRCCTQTHAAYTRQGAVVRELLYSGDTSTTAGKYSGAPSTKMRRLSRCLPQAQSPSSGSCRAEGDEEGEQFNDETVDGSLRFSVHFDQPLSRLVVHVLRVEGLPKHSQTCRLQLFVKLQLMWAGSAAVELVGRRDEEGEWTPPALWTALQEWQTRVVKGSCNTLFGDQFSCILQEDAAALQRVHLRIEVCDFDKFSRHTVLGEVRVPLGQLNISRPLELHRDLQRPQKDLVGEVLLSLKFLPTAQRLEVGLLKVRTVPTEICSNAALYVKISVQCNQYKLRYQRTSVVARCLVTIFNEVLMFSLPEFPMERCKILVSVYQTRTTWKSPKQLVGQLTVGKERIAEDEHWNLMMRSVRQPVAKWHGLLL
ncbi:putative synaptotagmin-2-like [Scophthalmus maximus]|uniref:Putative synaptotagmin-2-like n=1 Tax=Scophthalmus maximus TaxID=52904 RepID=A0A2U9BYW7_SCOMX|nr:putative synaptotagmin-2-like [Scophthalmus maximus]